MEASGVAKGGFEITPRAPTEGGGPGGGGLFEIGPRAPTEGGPQMDLRIFYHY